MDFIVTDGMFDPDRVLLDIGILATSLGIAGFMTGFMDRRVFCGWLAVGAFLAGLSAAATGQHGWAAVQAGLTAFNAYAWWNHGGDQQIDRLRKQIDNNRA